MAPAASDSGAPRSSEKSPQLVPAKETSLRSVVSVMSWLRTVNACMPVVPRSVLPKLWLTAGVTHRVGTTQWASNWTSLPPPP